MLRRPNFKPNTLLKIVCVTGLLLSVLISIVMLITAFHTIEGRPTRKEKTAKADRFENALENYDKLLHSTANARDTQHIGKLDSVLSDLERQAPGVQAQLSVLKRRRYLAKQYPGYLNNYRQASKRAFALYPNSQQIAMIAAEALIADTAYHSDTVSSKESGGKAELAGYIASISPFQEPVFALGLNILAENLADLQSARNIPDHERLISAAGAFIQSTELEELNIDIAILSLLDGNIQGALTLLETTVSLGLVANQTRSTIAEIFYDFGKPLRSAQILSPLSDPKSICRQADALYLAGYFNEARTFWKLLCSPGDIPVSGKLLEGALYNLAATDQNPVSARSCLKELMSLNPDHSNAVILYTRLLDNKEATSYIKSHISSNTLDKNLLELELLRRSRQLISFGRLIGETWLLIDRFPNDTRLYEWGVNLFDKQKQFGETELVFRNADFAGIESPRLTIHKALNEIIKGSLDTGEALLKSVSEEENNWSIQANLGIISEARRNQRAALPLYETALAKLKETSINPLNSEDINWTSHELIETQKRDTARLQLRIAKLLLSQRRIEEARHILEEASSLSPEDHQIRLELRRLRERTGY